MTPKTSLISEISPQNQSRPPHHKYKRSILRSIYRSLNQNFGMCLEVNKLTLQPSADRANPKPDSRPHPHPKIENSKPEKADSGLVWALWGKARQNVSLLYKVK